MKPRGQANNITKPQLNFNACSRGGIPHRGPICPLVKVWPSGAWMKNDRISFREKVLAVVASIPRGETLSYSEVAKRAGNKKGARAVGVILKTNFNPKIPCHRVIRKNGQAGGYNRGLGKKVSLLRGEGAIV